MQMYKTKPKGKKTLGGYSNGIAKSTEPEDILSSALLRAFGAENEDALPALDAIALAIAGADLEKPLGPSVDRIATAFESMALSLEYIAENLFEEEDTASKTRTNKR